MEVFTKLGCPWEGALTAPPQRKVGVSEDSGEERTQLGPEGNQEFNRPEDTGRGCLGKRPSQVGETQCGLYDQGMSNSQG